MTERLKRALSVAAVLASAAFLLAWACGLFGAPAPLPRPGPRLVKRLRPPLLAGAWALDWGRYPTATAVLAPGGDFLCRWGDEDWHGSWSFGLPRRLVIEERRPGGPPGSGWYHWEIDLLPRAGGRFDADDLRGRVGDCGGLPVRLRRLK